MTGRESTWDDIKAFCKMPNILNSRSRNNCSTKFVQSICCLYAKEWNQSISCIQSVSHDCLAEWKNFRRHPLNLFWEANSDLILQDSMTMELYDLRGTLSGFVTSESMKEVKFC